MSEAAFWRLGRAVPREQETDFYSADDVKGTLGASCQIRVALRAGTGLGRESQTSARGSMSTGDLSRRFCDFRRESHGLPRGAAGVHRGGFRGEASGARRSPGPPWPTIRLW